MYKYVRIFNLGPAHGLRTFTSMLMQEGSNLSYESYPVSDSEQFRRNFD